MAMNECRHCKFWKLAITIELDEEDGMGECRRHAPVLLQRSRLDPEQGQGQGQWPLTDEKAGCGDFENVIP